MIDATDNHPSVAVETGDLMAPASVEVPNEVLDLCALMAAEQLVESRRDCPEWKMIDEWERAAAELPQQLCPLDHVFTPGLYTRIIRMAAGTRLTSKIHIFEHPYVVAAGVVRVWTLETGWIVIRAPFVGVTKPATRRLLEIEEDTVWITSHINPTNETDPDKIVKTYDHMKLGHMDDVSPQAMAAILENQKGICRELH